TAVRSGRSFIFSIICLTAFVGAAAFADAPATQPAQDIDTAIKRGVEFLVKDQNADGSWGTGTKTNGFEVYSMVPGSMDAYKSGASALCVIALREAGEKTAHDKGLEYLL